MAKVKVLGDIMQIQSELTKTQFDRVSAFSPEMLKLKDEEGNEIFGVGMGDAFYSKYGVCFCSEDAGGKLFMSTNNPVREHGDAEAEKEAIVKLLAPILDKLNAVEEQVIAAEGILADIENTVRESVELI